MVHPVADSSEPSYTMHIVCTICTMNAIRILYKRYALFILCVPSTSTNTPQLEGSGRNPQEGERQWSQPSLTVSNPHYSPMIYGDCNCEPMTFLHVHPMKRDYADYRTRKQHALILTCVYTHASFTLDLLWNSPLWSRSIDGGVTNTLDSYKQAFK